MKDVIGAVRRRKRRTWLIYSLLFLVVVVGGYVITRNMINRPWSARSNVGGAVIGNSIYITGGQSASTGRLLDEVLRLNVDRSTMSFVAHLPYPCYLPATASDSNALYVAGGYDGQSYRSEILKVTPSSGDVQIVGHLPTPRTYGCAVILNNTLYYAGGWDGDHLLDEIVAINLATGDTSIAAHLSSPREFVSAAVLEGRAYFIGGEESMTSFSDEIAEFDPTLVEISRIGHLPSGRYLTSTVPWKDGLLVLTGQNDHYLDDLVTVDVTGDEIRSELTGHIPGLSWHYTVQTTRDRLFIIGGASSTSKRTLRFVEYVPETGDMIPFDLRGHAWK